MYSFLVNSSRPDPNDFSWHVYSKATPTAVSANLTLEKGVKFGVRAHPVSQHSVQVVVAGASRVYSVSAHRLPRLSKGARK